MSRYTSHTTTATTATTASSAPQKEQRCDEHDLKKKCRHQCNYSGSGDGSGDGSDWLASPFTTVFPLATLPDNYARSPEEPDNADGAGVSDSGSGSRGILGNSAFADDSMTLGCGLGVGKCHATPIVLSDGADGALSGGGGDMHGIGANTTPVEADMEVADYLADFKDDSHHIKKYFQTHMTHGDSTTASHIVGQSSGVSMDMYDVNRGMQCGGVVVDDTEKENCHGGYKKEGPMVDLNDDFKVSHSSESPSELLLHQPLSTVGIGGGVDDGMEIDGADFWECSRCTFSNSSLLDSCEICEHSRYGNADGASGPFTAHRETSEDMNYAANAMVDLRACRDNGPAFCNALEPMAGPDIDASKSHSFDSQDTMCPDSPRTDSTGTSTPRQTKHHDDVDGAVKVGRWKDVSLATTSQPSHRQDPSLLAGHISGTGEGGYSDGGCVYELVSVVRHVGRIAEAGHYTCDVKRADAIFTSLTSAISAGGSGSGSGELQRRWNRCDDAYVHYVSEVSSGVMKKTAQCRCFLAIMYDMYAVA
jgi:hypothetical protein